MATNQIDRPTGRRLTNEELARYLYEMMEEIEDDYSPGPPWDLLTAPNRVWYVECAERLLRDYHIHPAATVS